MKFLPPMKRTSRSGNFLAFVTNAETVNARMNYCSTVCGCVSKAETNVNYKVPYSSLVLLTLSRYIEQRVREWNNNHRSFVRSYYTTSLVLTQFQTCLSATTKEKNLNF